MMNGFLKYSLYFLLGGSLVSLSTYIGAQGRGFLAAFISTFPAITGVTIILIYLNGGSDPAQEYAKHLLWLVPAWVIYVGCLTDFPSVPRTRGDSIAPTREGAPACDAP